MEEAKVVTTVVTGQSGAYSYSQNSEFQRKAIDGVKDLIHKAVSESLDINVLPSSSAVRIAELGCAAGPNTFVSVQNIIDAIELKFQSHDKARQSPEFEVFFNDQAMNDFNQLFRALPAERRYFALGLPGSFHRRLFPARSIHFAHSSYSVHVLSRIPLEVLDKKCPAWNKGRIHYSNSSDDVVKAFEGQFNKDIGSFLDCRAEEIVPGGLLAFIIPGRPNGSPHSESIFNKTCELIESSLADLCIEGKITNEKIDSFNLQSYFASPDEVESLVKKNGCFGIEMIESVPQPFPKPEVLSTTLRAGMGEYFKNHFGGEILDDLLDLLRKKLEQNDQFVYKSLNSISLFVLLKRIPA